MTEILTSDALESFAREVPRSLLVSFSFGDASPAAIYSVEVPCVVREIVLSIETPFDGEGAALKVGTPEDDGLLMPSDLNLPSVAGAYEVTPMHSLAAGAAILFSITPGAGAMQGSGTLAIQL